MTNHIQLLEALKNFKKAAIELGIAWSEYEGNGDELTLAYPFTEDYTDVADKIEVWEAASKLTTEQLDRKLDVNSAECTFKEYIEVNTAKDVTPIIAENIDQVLRLGVNQWTGIGHGIVKRIS